MHVERNLSLSLPMSPLILGFFTAVFAFHHGTASIIYTAKDSIITETLLLKVLLNISKTNCHFVNNTAVTYRGASVWKHLRTANSLRFSGKKYLNRKKLAHNSNKMEITHSFSGFKTSVTGQCVGEFIQRMLYCVIWIFNQIKPL